MLQFVNRNKLRGKLREMSKTQADLAKELGVTYANANLKIIGKRKFNEEEIRILAKNYGHEIFFLDQHASKMRTKEELLMLSVWTYKEIMEYMPNIKSKTTAIKIKKEAVRKFDGAVDYSSKYATTESILALFGTSRDRELKLCRGYANEKELL